MMQLSCSCSGLDPHQYVQTQRKGMGLLSFIDCKSEFLTARENFWIYFQSALEKRGLSQGALCQRTHALSAWLFLIKSWVDIWQVLLLLISPTKKDSLLHVFMRDLLHYWWSIMILRLQQWKWEDEPQNRPSTVAITTVLGVAQVWIGARKLWWLPRNSQPC